MRTSLLAVPSFAVVTLLVCSVACGTPPEDAPLAPDPAGSEPTESAIGEPAPPPLCITARPAAAAAATEPFDVKDDTGHATARAEGEGCTRTFVLESTAQRRDALPLNGRRVAERAGRPTLSTGNVMFDALYQLALDEAQEGAVAQIKDGAFRRGAPVSCGPDGCFETGRKWTYVWTRDTAYAADLGLAWTDPLRAKGSLDFKLSAPRGKDASGPLFIVQDTGTGGSYPVSTDRAVWAIGARRVLAHLPAEARAGFGDRAARAIFETIDQDRAVAFDAVDGLYRGEQSFLDWRAQSYPEWTVPDTVHIAMSKALSTNVTHLALLETGRELAEERGDVARADRLRAMGAELRERIRARFWLPEEKQFATFIATELDPAPTRRFDLLGTSLAVLFDVATPEQASAAIESYPVLPAGPPVMFPEQQGVPIYHNRAIWPFVTAYWVKAAKKAHSARAVEHGVASLVRGAALNLSNMENLEVVTGSPWVEDGATSGPVVNSQRQLWSVAGYLGMVTDVLFGLEATKTGVTVAPMMPRHLRRSLFAGSSSLALNNVRLRDKELSVVLNLPPVDAGEHGDDGAYAIGRIRINGRVVTDGVIAESLLAKRNLVEIDLVDPAGGSAAASKGALRVISDVSDYRAIFAPRTPKITGVAAEGGKLAVDLDLAGEGANSVTVNVFRDGVRVATGLPGASTSRWIDMATSGDASPSHCYTAELRYEISGNVSHRAKPVCFWGPSAQRIVTLPAAQLAITGGTPVQAFGRSFHEGWGDAGHTLTATFTASRSGAHLVEAVYGNGAGSIDTGITCAVKRVDIEEVSSGKSIAGGYLVMPHRGDWGSWGESSYVRAKLVAGTSYRVRVSQDARGTNMSALAHFETYTGGAGGEGGESSHVNIAELKILSLTP
jgi:hypothetical protein